MRSDIIRVNESNRQAGHTGSDLAFVLQREKCEKTEPGQYIIIGHYRENDLSKKTNVLSSKSGWIRKERLTAQYRVGVFIGRRPPQRIGNQARDYRRT